MRLKALIPAASRRAWRLALRLVGVAIVACLALVLGFTLYAVGALPPLKPWHTDRLSQEFSAYTDRNLDFDGYLKLETRLFEEMAKTIAGWDSSDEAFAFSRFNPASALSRLAEGAPFNRSFRLSPPSPVGGALLIHGLTDSPYSVLALARSLHAAGFEVTVLRVPGHGTLPSMMVEMSMGDWTAAVRIAARDVAARTPAAAPFYIGGYSTGGTLALLHTLDTLNDPALRRPDRVLLISPAISLTRVAMLAEVIDLFSVVPVPLLEKVRWQEVGAEFDPYKFNSFPVNGARQVNRATRALQRALARADESGRLARLPPVVTWQSVVDSTVGSAGVVDGLYARLQGAEHRLVLFDVNREPALRSVQRPAAAALIERVERRAYRHTVDVVTSEGGQTNEVKVLRVDPGGARSTQDTGLTWPANLVSLGHVALPFPPDDPVYGFMVGSGRDGIPSIGSWTLRGESGATTISLGSLTRLRSNPFWSLIADDVAGMAAADVGRSKP